MFFENEKSVAVDKVACSNKHILPVLAASCEWLDRYFRGVNPGPVPPVLFRGSPFRMAVWKILQEIPYGRVMTYGEIARRLAAKKHISKMSAQAVGGAVGSNPAFTVRGLFSFSDFLSFSLNSSSGIISSVPLFRSSKLFFIIALPV